MKKWHQQPMASESEKSGMGISEKWRRRRGERQLKERRESAKRIRPAKTRRVAKMAASAAASNIENQAKKAGNLAECGGRSIGSQPQLWRQ